MAKFSETPLYEEYTRALTFFASAHRYQVRKNGVPYFSHLQSVAALVWKAGGSETEAIAALAHDYAEDHSDDVENGLEIIKAEFGVDVAAIVRGCTELDKSADWQTRKLAYIEQVKAGSKSVQLVSMCDKLDNLSDDVNERFNYNFDRQKAERTFWFYDTLYEKVYVRMSGSDYSGASSLRERYTAGLDVLKRTWGL